MSSSMALALVGWASTIFTTGLQLSLPIVAALLITTVALGILTRAAPQLNIFGIGFPISLGVGMLLLSQTLPYLSGPMQNLFNEGLEASRRIPRAAFERKAPVAPVPAPAQLAPAQAPTVLPVQ
jgi:flagellar biosynthetic protein FliR